MRIGSWSSDVCSSDLDGRGRARFPDRRERDRCGDRPGERNAAPSGDQGYSAHQHSPSGDGVRQPRLHAGGAEHDGADRAYRRRPPMSRLALPRWSLIATLGSLTLVAAVGSLLFGAVDLSVARLIGAAIGGGDRVASIILFDLRLPRTLLALAVGAMLGLAGAALQGYLHNPLAEPSVLGTSNAAALGGVAALYFGIAELHPVMLPLLATGGPLLDRTSAG